MPILNLISQMTNSTQEPIIIICGTNRPNSQSLKIAQYYQRALSSFDKESEILDLGNLPHDFTQSALYDNSGKNELFNELQRIIEHGKKFIFVVPEYNGSYPGVLKAFIDGLPYPNSFTGKKTALVGISSNMQGAALALSHLNDVFSYLGMNTLALRIKIGFVKKNFVDGDFITPIFKELIHQQIQHFVDF